MKGPSAHIQRLPRNREHVFYKEPRERLVSGKSPKEILSRREMHHAVISRNPRPTETLKLHTHLQRGGDYTNLPSWQDVISTAAGKYIGRPIRTEVIAIRNYKTGIVMGYIFCKLPQHAAKKIVEGLFNRKKKYTESKEQYILITETLTKKTNVARRRPEVRATLHNLAIKLLEGMGFQIRYVPNKKEGYKLEDGIFKKINQSQSGD